MRRTLLAMLFALVMASTLGAAGPARAGDPLGVTTARDQVVHKGCHKYPFTYRVNPPRYTSTWSAEMFLIGPRGGKVGSAYFLSPADATTGTSSFRLCRSSIILGTYTIRTKLTFIDIYDSLTTTVAPTKFRITRR